MWRDKAPWPSLPSFWLFRWALFIHHRDILIYQLTRQNKAVRRRDVLWPSLHLFWPLRWALFIRQRDILIWGGYEYGLFYRSLLQKRPIIWRSLLIVATPYVNWLDKIRQCGEGMFFDPHYTYSDPSDEPYLSAKEISLYVNWLDQIRQWGEGMFCDPHQTYSDPSNEPYTTSTNEPCYSKNPATKRAAEINFFKVHGIEKFLDSP